MKAEERHRLHENELHRLTEHARERSRPFFEHYGTTLLFALAGLLVLAAVVIWFWKRGASGSEVGWAELDAAFREPGATAEDFANVAEIAQGSPAASWARLYEGEAHLASGTESLFTDKEGALRDLGDAREAFEAVVAEKDATPELTVRAQYGLARSLEATSDGDLKPALDGYERIVSDYGDTVYAKLARERVDALKSADAKAFYAWFSKQKPAPKDTLDRPSDTGPALGSPATPPATTPPATTPPATTPPAATSPASDGGASPPAGQAPPGGAAGAATPATEPAAEEGEAETPGVGDAPAASPAPASGDAATPAGDAAPPPQ